MAVVGTVPDYQPEEDLDYDVDFNDFLPTGDDIDDVVATARCLKGHDTPALEPYRVEFAQGVVKTWIRGGANGSKWRVELSMTTVEGRIKEAEFDVIVKEI